MDTDLVNEIVCPFCGDFAGIDEEDGSIICDFCQAIDWDEE